MNNISAQLSAEGSSLESVQSVIGYSALTRFVYLRCGYLKLAVATF